MEISAREDDRTLLARAAMLVRATALFSSPASMWSRPGAVQNHERLLVSFTGRAAAKHAGHGAEVLKRAEQRLLAPVTHRQGCQIPAAAHFKELT